MTITVELVTPDLVDLVDWLYAEMEQGFHPAFRSCLDGPAYPKIEWIRAIVVEDPPAHDLLVARDDGTYVGFVVVWNHDRSIIWQLFNAGYVRESQQAREDAVLAFTYATLARYGTSYGRVHNPAVRAVMDGAHPRITVDDDGLVTFDTETYIG